MKTLMLTILVLLGLAGCAGQPTPEVQSYLLRPDASNAFNETDELASVGLGSLQVATYINQPGIVLETAGGSFTPARYHEWAEPLRESLRGFLANEIASVAGQAVRPRSYGETNWRQFTSTLIDIRIEQLHGNNRGEAVLVAYYALLDPQNQTVMLEREFRSSEPLARDGYPALVTAMKSLLNDLARDIAGNL